MLKELNKMKLPRKKTKKEQVELNQSIVFYTERLDFEKVLVLLKEGADVNAMDDENETLLTIASKTYKFDYVRSDGLADYLGLVKDEEKIAKILAMKKKLEYAGEDFSDGRASHGMLVSYITALADHTSDSRIELMKILLENGADINLLGKEGLNALFYAVNNAHPLAVDFLLKNSASTNINYFPEDEPDIYETILGKAYIDLTIAKSLLKDLNLYGYLFIDGMDEELLLKQIDDFKIIIELLEKAGAKTEIKDIQKHF